MATRESVVASGEALIDVQTLKQYHQVPIDEMGPTGHFAQVQEIHRLGAAGPEARATSDRLGASVRVWRNGEPAT